jgi:hypothetical protein
MLFLYEHDCVGSVDSGHLMWLQDLPVTLPFFFISLWFVFLLSLWFIQSIENMEQFSELQGSPTEGEEPRKKFTSTDLQTQPESS